MKKAEEETLRKTISHILKKWGPRYKMITKETLEEMVRKQLEEGENAREILDIHYKAQEFLTDEEFELGLVICKQQN